MTAYQVLARKWRPKIFSDLVGQEHVVKALQNALEQGRLHHAYLLTGTRGVGKTTIARILAKSLNCLNPHHGEPCGHCQSCTAIDQGRFVDLLEIDAASNTGIDNIREVLDNAQYAPTAGKYKVYIIDEVHMLSKSAFNAMLKTLEEPPEHVKFILATTDPHKVPITVLSRCLQFVLRNMTPQQVSAHLAHVLNSEQVSYEAPALTLLARAAAGSMRDALSLLDQAISMGSGSITETDVRHMLGAVDKHHLYELLNALAEQDGTQLITKAQQMAADAIGFDNTLNELALLFQRIALIQTVPAALSHDDPEYDILHRLAQAFHSEQIQLYYQCVIHGKNDLVLAPDEYSGFMMTLLRLLAFAPFAANASTLPNPVIETAKSSPMPTHTTPPTTSVVQKEFKPQDLPPPHPEEIRRTATPQNISQRLDTPLVPSQQAAQPIPPSCDDIPPWIESSEAVYLHDDTSEPIHFDDLPPPIKDFQPYPDDEAQQVNCNIPNTSPSIVQSETIAVTNEPPVLKPEIAVQTTPITHTPLPPLQPENWFDIAANISRQIAAAQMPLRHLAWVSLENNILNLAIVQEKTKQTDKREYIGRIEQALSEAYGIPITIHIQAWKDGMNWETPTMYHKRRLQEKRNQAQQSMEQDQAVQDILRLFNAAWRLESLHLKEESTISQIA